MKNRLRLASLREHKGSALIFVAITLVVLFGFVGLALDVGYLYIIRGELQNAADSGALAGAQVLYDDPTISNPPEVPGAQVCECANAFASDYVAQHFSEKATVTVESVERGHWNFLPHPGLPAGTFTPNPSTAPHDLWGFTTAELDGHTDFINAVRVITKRTRDAGDNLPAPFFAQIVGGQPSEVRATAVAYIGFAGKLEPHAVDQPVAICKQAITVDDAYSCGVGRMLNSGQNAGHETAAWTNFVQPCTTANANELSGLICGGAHGHNCTCGTGNPVWLNFGQTLGTTNGTQTGPSYDAMRDNCWGSNPSIDLTGPAGTPDGWPDQPWKVVLPVINCPPGEPIGNCSDFIGAVEINVVWMTRNDKNQMNEVPRRMGDWPPIGDSLRGANGFCNGSGQECWDSFVAYFHLQDCTERDLCLL